MKKQPNKKSIRGVYYGPLDAFFAARPQAKLTEQKKALQGAAGYFLGASILLMALTVFLIVLLIRFFTPEQLGLWLFSLLFPLLLTAFAILMLCRYRALAPIWRRFSSVKTVKTSEKTVVLHHFDLIAETFSRSALAPLTLLTLTDEAGERYFYVFPSYIEEKRFEDEMKAHIGASVTLWLYQSTPLVARFACADAKKGKK